MVTLCILQWHGKYKSLCVIGFKSGSDSTLSVINTGILAVLDSQFFSVCVCFNLVLMSYS